MLHNVLLKKLFISFVALGNKIQCNPTNGGLIYKNKNTNMKSISNNKIHIQFYFRQL